jgi:4-hydroxy-tetrahydrodipicolinate synthase
MEQVHARHQWEKTMPTSSPKGVLSPVVTPFDRFLNPDRVPWIAHCRWLLSQDCGLAIFGTNSEANSLSVAERRSLLEAAFTAGLDAKIMMPGTGSCSIPETVELTKAAVGGGAAGVLMLPPFYYKGVSDGGLFSFYSEVIQRVGDTNLRIYLYHIPPVAQVAISLNLIERLLKEYSGTVAGIKDSSGDWENTKAMIEGFDDFAVFAGSETFLLDTMRAGGAGCISATANINPAAIHDVYANWQAEDAEKRQSGITEFRKAVAEYPMIPALKAIIGITTGDRNWERVRPPLTPLAEESVTALSRLFDRLGFTMPGRKEAA